MRPGSVERCGEEPVPSKRRVRDRLRIQPHIVAYPYALCEIECEVSGIAGYVESPTVSLQDPKGQGGALQGAEWHADQQHVLPRPGAPTMRDLHRHRSTSRATLRPLPRCWPGGSIGAGGSGGRGGIGGHGRMGRGWIATGWRGWIGPRTMIVFEKWKKNGSIEGATTV